MDLINRDTLEKLLLTCGLFVDTFNVFLALPVFGVRLFYNKSGRIFEEHDPIPTSERLVTIYDPNGDYIEQGALQQLPSTGRSTFRKVLNAANTLDFLERERLHLFNKSELYLQYLLARELAESSSSDQILMDRSQICKFLCHLRGSIGFNVYSCWMDVARALKGALNLEFDRYFVGYLRRVYFSTSSIQRIPSISLASYRRIDLAKMGDLLKRELFELLTHYWSARFTTHVEYNGKTDSQERTFLTQRSSGSLVGALEGTLGGDVMVKVPLRWKRYKLPSKYSNHHDVNALLSDKRDVLLRAISLEKKSGGFLWQNLQAQQHSLGMQRCLILLYFVQLWLEFSVPAIVEKKKTLELTDYIYFSSIHITGDQWIGCPVHVRDAVCDLLKYKTGNLNTFKPAVDFSLTYLLKPFLAAFSRGVTAISKGIRVDGEGELRDKLIEAAKHEEIFIKLSSASIIDKACRSREIMTVTDVSRRGILSLLERDDWLSEIMCHRFVV